MYKPRLYFAVFDTFRFFAFLKIFLLHLPFNEENEWVKILCGGGEIGVDFFFVLSGFVITYMLAYEKFATNAIDRKNYVLRRTLRIWPLYFLGVIIAYSNNFLTSELHIGSSAGYQPNLLISVSFLENYRMIAENNFPNGSPLRVFWSLCVEEHFYLLWLALFVWTPVRKISLFLFLLWLTGIIYRHIFYFSFPGKEFYDIDALSKMDYFCCGGLVGYVMAANPDQIAVRIKAIPAWIRSSWMAVVVLFFFFHHVFITVDRIADLYWPIASSIAFGSLILLAIHSDVNNKLRSTGIFSKLGKISYGLYVYHTIIISGLLMVTRRYEILLNRPLNLFVFACICLALTIAVSHFSYRYFEKRFLALRPKP